MAPVKDMLPPYIAESIIPLSSSNNLTVLRLAWTGTYFDASICFLKDFISMRMDFPDKVWRGTAEYTYGGIIMMRLRKICMPLLVLAVLLLTASIPAAAGAKNPDFWISADGSLTADAITYTKADNGKFYLMLPDCLDTSKMCFGVGEGVRFTFGGKAVSTGDSAKVLKF